MTNERLLGEITRRLRARGVHVHVHPAVTTSSVYLRFDHGVLKQARIGDHRGKGYFYTYEIGKHVKSCAQIKKSFEGREYIIYRYSPEFVGDLVMQVLTLRANLYGRYGKPQYERYVEEAGRRVLAG